VTEDRGDRAARRAAELHERAKHLAASERAAGKDADAVLDAADAAREHAAEARRHAAEAREHAAEARRSSAQRHDEAAALLDRVGNHSRAEQHRQAAERDRRPVDEPGNAEGPTDDNEAEET
jgi:hypothetical protein